MDRTFSANFKARDVVDAALLHGEARIYRSYAAMIISGTLVGIGYVILSGNWIVLLFALSVLVLVALVDFFLLMPGRLARKCQKAFKQQKSLQVPYEYKITDETWYSTCELGNAKLNWKDFYKWKSNEKILLAYQSDLMFHMFPRRFFPTEAEYESFKQVLTREIGPDGKAKQP